MRRGTRLFLLCALAGCGGDAIRHLHERTDFAGDLVVVIRGAGGEQRHEGQLAFADRTGNFQFAVRRGERTVALTWLASGEVRTFVDGVPGSTTDADRALLTSLRRATRGPLPADAVVGRPGGGYAVRIDGRELELQYAETPPPHGTR